MLCNRQQSKPIMLDPRQGVQQNRPTAQQNNIDGFALACCKLLSGKRWKSCQFVALIKSYSCSRSCSPQMVATNCQKTKSCNINSKTKRNQLLSWSTFIQLFFTQAAALPCYRVAFCFLRVALKLSNLKCCPQLPEQYLPPLPQHPFSKTTKRCVCVSGVSRL